MADEDIELKIRALVEGARNVEGLANDVRNLSTVSRQPMPDPTSRLRRGLGGTRRMLQGAVVDVGSLQGAIAAFGAGALLRSIVRVNDTMTRLEGQLRLVTDGEEELRRTEERLFQASQDTRSSYESTVNLYARMARGTEDLNISQAELLGVTTSVNQAIQISGASSSEAASGVQQLTQALQSGVLRGEEFNSIMENSPRLARALADGLDVPLGKLRELAESGQLTAERVIGAIQSQADTIEQEFESLPRTVDQAVTQLTNSLQFAIREGDMSPLVDSIDDLRETIEDPQVQQGLVTFATGIVNAFSAALEAINKVVQGVEGLAEFIARQVNGPTLVDGLREDFERLRGDIEETDTKIELLRGRVQVSQRLVDQADPDDRAALEQRLADDRQALQDAIEKRRRQTSQLEDINAKLNEQFTAVFDGQGDGGDGGGDPDSPDIPTPDTGDGVDRRQKRIDGILAGLREQVDTYGQSAEQIQLYRLQLEGATEAELRQAEQLAGTIAARREHEQAIEDSTAAWEEYFEQLERNRQADRELIEGLEEKIRLQGLTEREQAQAAATASLSADATDEQREAVRRLAGELYDLKNATEEGKDALDQFAVQAARSIQGVLADFLFDPFEEGLDGLVDSVAETMQRIAAEIAAAQLAKAIFGDEMATGQDTNNSGGIDWGGLIGTAIQAYGSYHTGGIAGAGADTRRVSPLAFVGAPRYHSGGVAGLRADEVPAVLRRGEEVLTPSNPRHRRNAGGEQRLVFQQTVVTPDAASFRNSRAQQRRDAQMLMRRRG
ncbi:tape measure protein [Ectothiorhodospiraceae bacterium WFHF3C12]|nr:tape measure protein [Ectothiorhodospiraceae bacterium WFHF3C12]